MEADALASTTLPATYDQNRILEANAVRRENDETNSGKNGVDEIMPPSQPPPLSSRVQFWVSAVWRDVSSLGQRVSVGIFLHSGVGSGRFVVRVLSCGRKLQVLVKWPPEVQNVQSLFKKFLDDSPLEYSITHPEIRAIQDSLASIRDEQGLRPSDDIESLYEIEIPVQVETTVSEQYNLGWKDSPTRVVLIRLRVAESKDGFLNTQPFSLS